MAKVIMPYGNLLLRMFMVLTNYMFILYVQK